MSDEYSDVVHLDVMTEVDGIEIPRLSVKTEELQLTGELPVDVGNPRAKERPGEKAFGDQVVVLFNAEPKTLNPITENSAYKSYILQYVSEGLARENPETFEYEPHIAERWVAEDSVKLSPDYPGQERRVRRDDGELRTELEFDYAAPAEGSEPAVVTVTTTDKAGAPLAGVWVGVYPKERILGAPATGYHTWSDTQGTARLGNYPTGRYVVRVGAEVYGKTVKESDGTLVITPATDENPLREALKSTPNSTLTLKPGEWIDRHEQTYYTFYLRPDAKWSDGTPYTTKDLEFAYAALNNPTVDGDHIRVYYQDLVECTALGPHVVRMRYRQQYFKAFEFAAGMSAYGPPWHVFVRKFQSQGKELTLERLSPEEEAAQKKVSGGGTWITGSPSAAAISTRSSSSSSSTPAAGCRPCRRGSSILSPGSIPSSTLKS
jgi:peptide/nickel transport system substrate-binding protein